MNLNITQQHIRCEKELEHFQKKENSSSIKKEKCYNYNTIESYTNKCRKLKKLQDFTSTRK